MASLGVAQIVDQRSWDDLKKVIDGTEKSLELQVVEDAASYLVFAYDAPVLYTSTIFKDGAEPSGWAQDDVDANTAARTDYLNNYAANTNRKHNETVAVVSDRPTERVVQRAYHFSVDWTKKQTWWQDVGTEHQVVGEAHTGDGATTQFQLAHGTGANGNPDEAIVCLTHGLITLEDYCIAPGDSYPGGFVVGVKVDGVDQVERLPWHDPSYGDWTLDYRTGLLTFDSPPADGASILVDYWYVPEGAKGSLIAAPTAGKIWAIDLAETQVSLDIDQKDTILQNVFDPDPDGGPDVRRNPIDIAYKRFGQFLDFGVGSFPQIPAMGGPTRGTSQPSEVIRWDYRSSIYLPEGSYLKVWLENGNEFGGERATTVLHAKEYTA